MTDLQTRTEATPTVRDRLPAIARTESVLVPLVIAIAAIVVVSGGSAYHTQILLNIAIYATYALSLYLIMGLLGEVSFGHGLYLGLGGYLMAITADRFTESFAVGVLLSVVGCAAFAGITGLLAARLHLIPFAMLTFALNGLLFVTAQNATNITYGEIGLVIPRPEFLRGEGLVWTAVILLAVAYFGVARLRVSRLGFKLVAIRDNEPLAESVGVRPWPYRLLLLVMAGTLGGVAGILFGMNLTVVTPGSFAIAYTAAGLLIVVVGGRGGPAGALLGAIFFVAIPELLRTSDPVHQLMVFGVVLILTVRFLPEGLLGVAGHLGRLVSRKASA